jgi:hypothetical protein
VHAYKLDPRKFRAIRCDWRRSQGKKVAPASSATAIELVFAPTIIPGMKFAHGQQNRLKVTTSVAGPGVSLTATVVKLIINVRLISPPAGLAAGNATPVQAQTKGIHILHADPRISGIVLLITYTEPWPRMRWSEARMDDSSFGGGGKD